MSLKTQAKVLRVLAGAGARAPGQQPRHQGRRARDRRHQQEPRRGDCSRHVPRGPVLSPQCHPDSRAAAARSQGRHGGAGAPLRRSVLPREQLPAQDVYRRRDGAAEAAPLARQHPRAAQLRRAADHHEPGDQIDVKDLPEFAGVRPGELPSMPTVGDRAPPQRRRPAAKSTGCGRRRCRSSSPTSERAFLVNKLRENGWNISKTAEVIDTPRSNLYKKLEQYQISQETDG